MKGFSLLALLAVSEAFVLLPAARPAPFLAHAASQATAETRPGTEESSPASMTTQHEKRRDLVGPATWFSPWTMNSMLGWSPGRAMMEMLKEMEQIQEAFGGERTTTMAPFTAGSLDVSEDNSQFILKMDVPGLSKEDMSVSVKDGFLHIDGERKYETKKEGERFHRVERTFGKIQRSIKLPSYVDDENPKAKMDSGVLQITLNKKPEAMEEPEAGRTIDIE
jgi:HSP20 family protein